MRVWNEKGSNEASRDVSVLQKYGDKQEAR